MLDRGTQQSSNAECQTQSDDQATLDAPLHVNTVLLFSNVFLNLEALLKVRWRACQAVNTTIPLSELTADRDKQNAACQQQADTLIARHHEKTRSCLLLDFESALVSNVPGLGDDCLLKTPSSR